MSKVNFSFPRVRFKLSNTPIDYFKLGKELFEKDGFHFSKEEIKFNDGERYLDGNEHFNNLDVDKKETVVLNFQVGKGKTSIFYQLVGEHYNNGYKIIICSPFIKLIEKDLHHIVRLFPKNTKRSKFAEIYNWPIDEYREGYDNVFFTHDYSALDAYKNDLNIYRAVSEKPIHLLTINTLLGNPGDDRLFQSGSKQKYVDRLLRLWKDQKVVIFFDEIHESKESFKSLFVPNLYRWNGIVNKIYISSATFTPASIPIIKAFASLTDNRLTVFESDRKLNDTLSDMSLHVMPSAYNSKTNYFINHVDQIIKGYTDKSIPVNIITSSRTMAEIISVKSFGNNVIKDRNDVREGASLDSINLCTALTEVPFQPNQNNIGTTFKTGINIDNPNSALIIIFPTIRPELNYQYYGIFSDGVQSIIQTVGRMRNSGDIHLIISKPRMLIKYDYPTILKGDVNETEYLTQNESYNEVLKVYNDRIEKLDSQVKDVERNLTKTALLKSISKRNFGFWYPNIHEFLIQYSQTVLLSHINPSFGNEISAYVLWAVMNNQFANAKLSNIYHIGSAQVIQLSESNANKVFRKVFESHIKEINQVSFRDSLNNLKLLLDSTGDGNNAIPIKYSIKKKEFTAAVLINKYPGFINVAVEELYKMKFGTNFPLNQYDYINSCLNEIANVTSTQTENILHSEYCTLKALKFDFDKWVKDYFTIEKKDILYSMELFKNMELKFAEKVQETLLSIQKLDIIFSSKAISFMQGLTSESGIGLKKSIFNFFLQMDYNILPRKKQIDGVIHKVIHQKKPLKPTDSKLL